MTKLQQMLTSLVAAIPAAYLGYELVMTMLFHSENLSTIAYLVIGITLIAAITAALIPAIILVGGRRKAEPKKEPARKKDSGDDLESLDDEVAVMEESSDAIDISETSDFQLGDSSSDLLASGSDDNLSSDAIDDFDLDDDDDEVKPKAKSKKKKR